MKKIISLLVLLIAHSAIFAQQGQDVEMADFLFESGKIYVVVSVLSVIFIGIIIYLISLDRKISKLEKEVDNK